MNREEIEALGLKDGDRVRLRIDAFVRVDEDGDFLIGERWLGAENLADVDAIVERAPEPFKPGDVVRDVHGDVLVLLGESGYRYLTDGRVYTYGDGAFAAGHFVAPAFERVTV